LSIIIYLYIFFYYCVQILLEFLELKKIIEKALFDEKIINKIIEKLIKYYSVTKSTNNNKAFIMQYLWTDLRKKNKNFPALFTVKKVSIGFDLICYIFSYLR